MSKKQNQKKIAKRKLKLTDPVVAGLEPEAAAYFVWDADLTGFGVRVMPSGAKSFTVMYRVPGGPQRKKSLGAYKDPLTVAAARNEAKPYLRGGDLIAEEQAARKAAEQAERNACTVAQLAGEWLEDFTKGKTSANDIRAYIENDLIPALGEMRPDEVTTAHVYDMVRAKARTASRAAAILLIYTRKLFKYASIKGHVAVNPAGDLKPTDISGVQGQGAKRARVLDPEEIAAFWNSDGVLNLLHKLALQFTLVTGQRSGKEVGMMRWDEIEGRIWTIPAERRGKTESAHTVYLTDLAMELLDAAREEVERLRLRRNAPCSPYVFETGKGGPLAEGTLAKDIRENAQQLGNKAHPQWGYWRPHDLRRTMRTGLSAERVDQNIAELAIGHVKKGIVAVYDQHEYGPERQAAMERWERRLRQIVSGQSAEIVELGKAM